MPQTPSRHSRRRLLKALAIGASLPAALGFYAWQVEPFWPEFHELPMPVPNLPAAFEGARIAHLTDLHIFNGASREYVSGVIRQVNRLKPDAVLLTGDLVTLGRNYVKEACEVVSTLVPKTFISFGNHDYAREKVDGREVDVADEMEARLTAAGFTVLRNRPVQWQRGGEKIWIVGMEDLWSGRFYPGTAFASIDSPEPIIAMSHNPDTAPAVDNFNPAWILAGHTHGGQIRIPGYGAVLLPIQHKEWQQGCFKLRSARLYVSRGIGFLARARFCCRPEVAIFTMTRGA